MLPNSQSPVHSRQTKIHKMAPDESYIYILGVFLGKKWYYEFHLLHDATVQQMFTQYKQYVKDYPRLIS